MEQLHVHAETTAAHVQTILKMERAPPFTQNTHYLADKRSKLLAQYCGERQSITESSSVIAALPFRFLAPTPRSTEQKGQGELVKEALAALAALGFHAKEEDLHKLNPPDEFEEELEMMAEVRAYFQVAYKVRRLVSANTQLLKGLACAARHRLHSAFH